MRLYITQQYITWGLCWEGSQSTKPCFLGNVASAGDEDERYLVCAAGGAAAVVPDANRFSLGVRPRLVIHVCVVLCAS